VVLIKFVIYFYHPFLIIFLNEYGGANIGSDEWYRKVSIGRLEILIIRGVEVAAL
jgi:hypothetical protein